MYYGISIKGWDGSECFGRGVFMGLGNPAVYPQTPWLRYLSLALISLTASVGFTLSFTSLQLLERRHGVENYLSLQLMSSMD